MIARESILYIAVLSLLSLILYIMSPALAIAPVLVLLFVIFFFRNPPRQVTPNNNHILSAADGTVQSIQEIDEDTFIKGRAIKISIFLSLLNAHINRSPVNGQITYTSYRPGQYLPAFKSHASDINERNTLGIENGPIKILVHQITGFVARRIVCYNQKGDYLQQGQIFGLIKFGSCTEIVVPADIQILVQKGQKVQAGITVIGVLKND
ncbi:phosphatidylserine decarboxylase family protein [Desulfoscipio gibsoniae]|uniref:Phosphatidylserine decarboxylase proenzyme n=1 Tax=Desulfoscipio gibsoniae DSM 7213 TaxID=767817 RepID=R4KPV5_9FIRM|nr:phosphatidylserine decarboxylase family protein [Desulfoscipio gibsoniae]AGL03557.1 phosphatidylserine decarboxylase precursor-related protein [Desulfoscipio gibsoniae DSM 7213]